MLENVRKYIDELQIAGYSVGEDHDDDPVLIDPAGRAVDTWRENYPYDERMDRNEYDEQKYLLQVELLKLQNWIFETGEKHVMVFEGRDAAGKGGTIKRFMEHLNPRYARVVALTKPYGARAAPVVFPALRPAPADRRARSRCSTAAGTTAPASSGSWASRHRREYEQFMQQVPLFEQMLVESGIHLDQVLVLGHPVRAADPVHHPPGRPGPAVEAVADRPAVAGQVGRLHRGQGGDVPAHRHRHRAVDDHEVQRQEAGADQRDARTSCPASTTRARTTVVVGRPTRCSSSAASTPSATEQRRARLSLFLRDADRRGPSPGHLHNH